MEAEDAPLVYVNQEFSTLTGYSAEACLGRNCRFLQGPNTNPVSVAEISRALKASETAEICLLNYRRDGTGFHNLLILSPFQGRGGRNLFLGCQFELNSKALRVEEHLEQVDGVVRMIASDAHSPWSHTINSMKMRSQAIASLVHTYAAREMSGS